MEKMLRVKMPGDEFRRLRVLAALADTSMSALVRQLVRDYDEAQEA